MSNNQSKQLADVVIDFLTEKNKENILPEIVQELKEVSREISADQEIRITTAIKLENNEKDKLQKFFDGIIEKKQPIKNIVDTGVLGGIRLEWGDWMIDMTLKSRLNQLKKTLINI